MSGTLNRQYSLDRKNRKEFVFRYKTRSLLAHCAIDKYLSSLISPRLLDFGAADGMNLLEFNGLLKGDWTLTGIEYSTELIAEAPEFPSHIQIRKGDITQPLPAQDQGTYDVVTALAVLEHLKNPLEAVRNACVALKSGGIFVATCPVPFWDELASRLGLLNNDQHECELDLAAVLGCFEAVGLDVVEFGKFMWAPTSFVPYLGVRLSPAISLNIDAHVRKLKVFDFLFVNQYAIGRRP